MALSQYRQVLHRPGAASLLILGFIARIPFSTMGLLLTLHTVTTLGETYFAAGLIVTASTLGSAISSPWRGRLVDKYGLRRALLPSVIVEAVVWLVAPHVGYWLLLPLALVGGLFNVPIWSVIRVALAIMVPASLRRSAYALDSVFTEIVYMIGPAAITVVAVVIGTRPSMMIVGVAVALAGLGLMWANPPTRSDDMTIPAKLDAPLDVMENAALAADGELGEKRAREDHDIRSARTPDGRITARRQLLQPGGIAALVATAVGSMIITATDVSVVAVLGPDKNTVLIGIVIATWCVGSAIGGLAYGALRTAISPLWVLFILGALTIPIMWAHSVWQVALLILVAGLGCAPIIASTGDAIAQRVPEEARGEAMGWHGSAMTVGAAVGGPIIGFVIDTLSPGWGFGVSGMIGVICAVAGLLATRHHRMKLRAALARS
ncbi:MFS transporter [Devriesea agamarum]|uniref:MFS transporter n=1 Tax=Devriesea agamarum TaxID=472569 RepID=UPI00071C87CE|nr:MFS transporter [Devriesea agamarum]